MARMTAQLFRELLESLDDDVETLGMEEVMTEGEDVPNQTECAAIARVKQAMDKIRELIREELSALESIDGTVNH
jgi:hypothetical protein